MMNSDKPNSVNVNHDILSPQDLHLDELTHDKINHTPGKLNCGKLKPNSLNLTHELLINQTLTK